MNQSLMLTHTDGGTLRLHDDSTPMLNVVTTVYHIPSHTERTGTYYVSKLTYDGKQPDDELLKQNFDFYRRYALYAMFSICDENTPEWYFTYLDDEMAAYDEARAAALRDIFNG
ncbi:hypothetical protein EJN64_06365 [Salmonella enterica]|nr:hypothetical protein [Salmonella enterica]MJY36626.1 hypothetical protein [Salmonella enterica subsp. enterica serovar Abony]